MALMNPIHFKPSIKSKLTSITTIILISIPTSCLAYNNQLSNAFRTGILPILFDIGRVIFICSVVYGSYYIIRRQYPEGSERIKYAAIGYIILRLTDAFVNLVDNIANNIKF
jgi:hypothetical protein